MTARGMLGGALMMGLFFGGCAAGAGASEAMTFAAPGGLWQARIPGPDCPTSCTMGLGTFAEFGLGVAALRAYAATHRPDGAERLYSPGLAPIPFRAGEHDSDGDGRDDRFGFAHPFSDSFTVRRDCIGYLSGNLDPGWQAALNGGPVTLAEEAPAPGLQAIAAQAYLRPAGRCSLGRDGPQVERGHLPIFELARANGFGCPSGFTPSMLLAPGRGCRHLGGVVPERNLGAQCPALSNGSNPINAVTGNKYQREVDYGGTWRGQLIFARHYNSQATRHGVLGARWIHGYERSLTVSCVHAAAARACAARAQREDGRIITYTQVGQSWQADATVVETLRADNGGGFELRAADGTREAYTLHGRSGPDTDGYRLSAITDGIGAGERLNYDSGGRLVRVTDAAGRSLEFGYDSQGRLAEVRDPAGQRYGYTYDVYGNLAQVSYPDLDASGDVVANQTDPPQRRYLYESAFDPSLLTGIIDENGARFATWTYDASGRARSSEHGDGVQRIEFDYQQGYTAISDGRGQTRSFNTTLAAGVGLISAVSGAPCNFCGPGQYAASTYDAHGFRNLVTDAAGNITDYDHDGSGLELKRVEAHGTPAARSIVTRWDPDARAPAEIELRNAHDRLVWRQTNTYWNGRIKTRVDEDPTQGPSARRRTEFTYYGEDPAGDAPVSWGLLRRIDGPRSEVADLTHYTYDALTGNLLAVTNALGHVTRFTRHDAHGRALEWVDPNGVATALHYHPRGWLLGRDTAGAQTRYRYDAAGQLTRVELPDGSFTDYAYDAAHRLVGISDTDGNALRFTLDSFGNRVAERVFDPAGVLRRELTRTYDEFNQLAQIVSGAGVVTHHGYDRNGNLVSLARPRATHEDMPAQATTFAYDALNRMHEMRDALGGITRMTHGPRHELTGVVAPNGADTRLEYNGFGELVAVESPDAGRTEYAYDPAGNRVRQSDARGIGVGYAYDSLNRLTKVDYPAEEDVTLTYDGTSAPHGIGRLTERADEAGTTRYRYDVRGNVAQKAVTADGGSRVVHYEYTLADRLAAVVYPSGRRLDYARAASGRVLALTTAVPGQAPETVIDAIVHEPFGPPRTWRHGNGVAMTRRYDHDYRLVSLAYERVLRRAYAHDSAGNIVSITREDDPAQSEIYAYDDLDRLVRADGPWGHWHYAYDANGNRTHFAAGTVDEHYRYHAGSNRLDAIVSNAGRMLGDYRQDAAGNLTFGTAGQRYAYGDDNRLASVLYRSAGLQHRFTHHSGGGIATETFELGSRARTQVWHRRFFYDESAQLIEIKETATPKGGTRIIEFIHLDELPVAWKPGKSLQHLHVDHLGTTIAATAPGGAEYADFSLRPFAGSGEFNGSWVGDLAYPGQFRLNGNDDVLHNGAREYEVRTGRYLQSDPIGLAGGLNSYAYAGNNPIRFADPAGLAVWACSRQVDRFTPTIGYGNHAYLWDDRTGASCSMQGSFGFGSLGGNEPGWPKAACSKVARSDGWEDRIMECCMRNANNGLWFPILNDCHEIIDDCVGRYGLENPGAPGGRMRPRCDVFGCR